MLRHEGRSKRMSVKQEPTTAIARRSDNYIEPWRGIEWQRLWLSLQARPWTAMAVIPASSGAPANFTMTVAVTLARTGMIHLASPIHVADATDLALGSVVAFLDEIGRCKATGERILIALAPMAENPVSETLAQSADCALLCVLFENMASAEAKRTVTKLGKDHFIGSTIFRADGSFS
jgi:hypothetical protein